MDHAHLEPPSSQIPAFRRGGEVHDDPVAYESMDGDGPFHFTSESIFNDQEHTDLPPDKDDSDFEYHDACTHVEPLRFMSGGPLHLCARFKRLICSK
jgi:hypothetical protein